MTSLQAQKMIRRELQQAVAARSAGKDGMARVCARRAAGIAAGMFLRDHYFRDPGPSAMDRLNYLAALSQIPPGAQSAIAHLTERVNENHELNSDADLIFEAKTLITFLLPEMTNLEE